MPPMPPMPPAFLGILSLDTVFPRIEGDAGNPASFPFPARVRVVAGADPTRIVQDGKPVPALVAAFADAARALEAEGAFALISTCGFLITSQPEIAASVGIPVMLSGLGLLPLLQPLYGSAAIGVMTASARSLGPVALAAAGADPARLRIGGMEEEPLFAGCFIAPKAAQPRSFARDEMAAAVLRRAQALVAADPGIAAILLECGNLPPYAAEIRAATGRPVYSILDGAALMHRAAGHP